AAWHETHQSAERTYDNSFLDPIIAWYFTACAPERSRVQVHENQPGDQCWNATLEGNLQIIRMHVAHWYAAILEQSPFAPMRFDRIHTDTDQQMSRITD